MEISISELEVKINLLPPYMGVNDKLTFHLKRFLDGVNSVLKPAQDLYNIDCEDVRTKYALIGDDKAFVVVNGNVTPDPKTVKKHNDELRELKKVFDTTLVDVQPRIITFDSALPGWSRLNSMDDYFKYQFAGLLFPAEIAAELDNGDMGPIDKPAVPPQMNVLPGNDQSAADPVIDETVKDESSS